MTSFMAWFHAKNFVSVRSFILYVTVWMTWHAYEWAAMFAITTDKSGAEVALIIAAVTAPISVLQGSVFSVYSNSRKKD